MRSLRILPVLGAATLALAACTSGSPAADSTAPAPATQPAAEPTVLNVYAAASLTETFGELEKTFEAVNKYPIALVSASTKKDLGQKWIDLVLSADGQKILEDAGFTPAAK